MEKTIAIATLVGLAHETRLDIYRLLVEAGPNGQPAGAIGERLGLAPATLSFHLATLKHAGLIDCRRHSRSLIYAADFTHMNALVGYLTENCCQGAPEACGLPACNPVPAPPTATIAASRILKGASRHEAPARSRRR